ncbi:N-formylglutamate deformylase [Aquicoccus sp. SCR17]|nr:N-formylglutamate deformylase [Carideicomes alvinocaridis]
MSQVEVSQGTLPVVLGMPHTGTQVPPEVQAVLNETGRALSDTDWHIHDLFAGLLPGASTVRATFHRYLIDANRDPSGASLYPGQNTTGLCPVTDFDGTPLYREGHEPDEAEIARRRAAHHAPYHDALEAELARLQAIHGQVLLFDCHSIRSVIPHLFDGTLPDLNIGTDMGRTCDPTLEQIAVTDCAKSEFSHVLNGRFRGGWTTRHYGDPARGRHAIQLEIAQSTYMEEVPPWRWRDDRADRLRPVLVTLLDRLATATAQMEPL